MLWFHEFLLGGPDTTDKVYGNFNQAAFYTYITMITFTLSGLIFSRGYNVGLATNSVTFILGMLMTWLIQ